MLCDGNADCPDGEDEQACEDFQSVGLLRCRGDDICIDPTNICDGIIHCLISGDDEKLCHMLPCPERCICRGTSFKCYDLNETNQLSAIATAVILEQTSFTRKIDFGYFSQLLYLNISNCNFANGVLSKVMFATSVHILTVVIRQSRIKHVQSNSFESMIRLKILNLHNNEIYVIHPFCFLGLQSILNLDLSNFNITITHALAFFGMFNLNNLNLSTNRISTVTASAYYGLTSIQVIDLGYNHILFTEDLKLLSLSSMNDVIIHVYMDSTVLCCSLHKSICCFVGKHKLKPHTCNPLVTFKMCYINILLSLSVIFIDLAIFLFKKSTSKSGSQYTILKQLLMANLLESSYIIIRDAVFLINETENIYLNTIWIESIPCNILNVIFFIGFVVTQLFWFTLVVDQLIAVRSVLKRNIWSSKVIWCITSCWVTTLLMAVLQQILVPNITYACIPILLTHSNPLRLFLTWSLLLTTFSFIAVIPIMYIMIARHVKASNTSVHSKNTLTNQKGIIRNGIVSSAVAICSWFPMFVAVGIYSWLPMFIAVQFSYFQPKNKCVINYIVDAAIHASEYAFMFYFCYKI